MISCGMLRRKLEMLLRGCVPAITACTGVKKINGGPATYDFIALQLMIYLHDKYCLMGATRTRTRIFCGVLP
jgi:hypothetical protein